MMSHDDDIGRPPVRFAEGSQGQTWRAEGRSGRIFKTWPSTAFPLDVLQWIWRIVSKMVKHHLYELFVLTQSEMSFDSELLKL